MRPERSGCVRWNRTELLFTYGRFIQYHTVQVFAVFHTSPVLYFNIVGRSVPANVEWPLNFRINVTKEPKLLVGYELKVMLI